MDTEKTSEWLVTLKVEYEANFYHPIFTPQMQLPPGGTGLYATFGTYEAALAWANGDTTKIFEIVTRKPSK